MTIPPVEPHPKSSLLPAQRVRIDRRVEFSVILFGLYTSIIPINPILNFTGSGTVNKYLGLLVTGAMLLSILIMKRPFLLRRDDLPILIYIPFALASYFWSINQGVTLAETIRFILFIAFAIVLQNKIYTDSEKNFIKLCCIFGSLVVSFYLISTRNLYYTRALITTSGGQATDPNGLSSSIAFGLLFLFDAFFRTKSRITMVVTVSLMMVVFFAMLLTGSRGGILGLLFGIAVYLLMSVVKRKYIKARLLATIIFIVGLAVLIGTVMVNYLSSDVYQRMTLNSILETGGTGRFAIWENAVEAAYERAIIGYGFGAGPYVLEHFYGTFAGTHNDILFTLLGTGVIGCGLLALFLWNILKTSYRKNDILSVAMLTMVIMFSLSLDYLLNKNLWNVVVYAQIGLGIVGNARGARLKSEPGKELAIQKQQLSSRM
ncbi:MAG TPA: O-antigen ligase family protein [Anaerolineaceae bacterium]|nr:O-antigen ligase family protein [Anaerolineaceae bacterium]